MAFSTYTQVPTQNNESKTITISHFSPDNIGTIQYQQWTSVGRKQGGTNFPGKLGGWYYNPNTNKYILVKQDVSKNFFTRQSTIYHAKNISEVVAGKLMQLINKDDPDSFANVYFIAVSDNEYTKTELPNKTGNNIYVASEAIQAFNIEQINIVSTMPREVAPRSCILCKNSSWELFYIDEERKPHKIETSSVYGIDKPNSARGIAYTLEEILNELPTDNLQNLSKDSREIIEKLIRSYPIYKDLFKDAYAIYQDATHFWQDHNKNPTTPVPENRPKLAGSWNREPMKTVIEKGRYINLSRLIAASIFVDDPDVHSANIGAIPILDEIFKLKAVRIDFAAALKNLDSSLHFYDILRYLPGLGPTNHVREWPEKIIICEDFTKALDSIAYFNVTTLYQAVNEIINDVARFYDKKCLIEFAKRIGTNYSTRDNNHTIIEKIKDHLFNNLMARRQAAAELSLDVKISLCFKIIRQGIIRFDKGGAKNLEVLLRENPQYFFDRIRFKLFGKKFHFHREDQYGLSTYNRLTNAIREKFWEIYPVALAASIKPFSVQLKNAFHEIFNFRNEERLANVTGFEYLAKSLLGYPSKGFNLRSTLFPLTFVKNIIKLVTEYLPAVFETFFGYIYQHSKLYLSKPANSQQLDRVLLAGISSTFSFTLHWLFKISRLLLMRITSPIRSIKQAYEFGYSVSAEKKSVGYFFAFLSTAMTATSTAVTVVYTALPVTLGLTFLSVKVFSLAAITAATIALTLASLAASYIIEWADKKFSAWHNRDKIRASTINNFKDWRKAYDNNDKQALAQLTSPMATISSNIHSSNEQKKYDSEDKAVIKPLLSITSATPLTQSKKIKRSMTLTLFKNFHSTRGGNLKLKKSATTDSLSKSRYGLHNEKAKLLEELTETKDSQHNNPKNLQHTSKLLRH